MCEYTEKAAVDSGTEILNSRLSTRSKNALLRNGIETYGQLKGVKREDMYRMRGLGRKSIDEIMDFRDNLNVEPVIESEDVLKKRRLDKLTRAYIDTHLISVESLGLGVRSYHALKRRGYDTFKELVELLDSGKFRISNVGKKGKTEILNAINNTFNSIRLKIENGEVTEKECYAKDLEELEKEVLFFIGEDFNGRTITDISLKFGAEGVDAFRVLYKKDKVVKEEDGLFHAVYPKAREVISKTENEKYGDIFLKKLDGKTLEEIGRDYSLTRERIRQLLGKSINMMFNILEENYHLCYCDEDKYKYLFETYYLNEKVRKEYGVEDETYNYLKTRYFLGNKPIEEATGDFNLNCYERKLILSYVQMQYVKENGVEIPLDKYAIEDYLITHKCINRVSYEEYVELYKQFTEKHHITRQDVCWKDECEKYRCNQLATSRKTLWVNHSSFRFYDIDSKDYTELYEVLNLGQYKDTEISTKLLLKRYPLLMRKYDIRDEYELHNLIRKTFRKKYAPTMKIGRQPTLRFGNYNRDELVKGVLNKIAPCTPTELAEAIEAEYGFNSVAVSWGNWFDCIEDRLVDGKYIAE